MSHCRVRGIQRRGGVRWGGVGGANARLCLLLVSVEEKLLPSEPFFGLCYATTETKAKKKRWRRRKGSSHREST